MKPRTREERIHRREGEEEKIERKTRLARGETQTNPSFPPSLLFLPLSASFFP
jgi:hypothetical protein